MGSLLDENTIGIIGFGQFGKFMAQHLAPHATIKAYDVAGGDDPMLAPLEEVCASHLIIFAVPVQNLEAAAAEVAPHVQPTSVIVDVSSVKAKPVEILKKNFPNNEILGLHPIFGPQSGKHGIRGLPIVITNVSFADERYERAKLFLSKILGLRVIERTADQHDQEMAYIQGLSHFIARGLMALDIQTYETATESYNQLIELKNLLKEDSWELFKTIQNENPYTIEVRERFLKSLEDLEDRLAS